MEVLNYRLKNPHTRFIVATVGLAAAIFVVDMSLPLGHVVWVPYVVLVLLSLWSPHRHYTLVIAAACTVLIILGFLFCPPGISPGAGLLNRSLGVLVIWVTAALCLLRKREEATRQESEAHFRAVAESAPNAFVGTDSRGRIISWNKAAQWMFQYTEEEILGQPLTLIMPERYREACERGMERHQRAGTHRFIGRTAELHGQRRDGSEFPVEVSLSAWETERGEVYHGIIHDITERKQAEEKVKSSLVEVRALAAHLRSVREEEGIRVARAIHDELSPALTALMMDLSQLASGLTTDQKLLVGKIEIMSKLVETTIQSMRKIAGELRPGVLDDLGLVAAIEWQAQEFQTRTGIRCEAILPVEDIALDSARSTAIFRICQEILTNVARHSRASRVTINLREGAGNVMLEAQDNGKGISESEIANPKSLGLLGMRERVLLFGGEVKISGIPGKGTTVTVRIPLK